VGRPGDSDEARPETRQAPDPQDAASEESEIDQVLADSFPASDAPPWTLGVRSRHSRKDGKPNTHQG
jgi:hypothetical protein